VKRFLLPAAIALLAGCGGGDAGTNPNEYPAIDTVFTPTLQDFSPRSITIRRGGTVVFSIFGYDHNVIFELKNGAPQDIPATTNQNVSRVFQVAGTFLYECRLHPGMEGEVIVK
jgi:plastocyanin